MSGEPPVGSGGDAPREEPAAGRGEPPPAGPPPAPPFTGRRFDRFTERAKRSLVLAQEEGRLLAHNYIGTEHILLGLIRAGEGGAAAVLHGFGVELDTVRAAVEHTIGRGDRLVVGEVSLAPRVRKVIELAVEQARRLGNNYVGTEHLLLGIVIEGEGVAAGVLEALGVDLGAVRARLLQALASPEARVAEPAPAARTNVLTCRLDDADLAAIDTLLEAGVRTTRSEAASWLIHAGIQANRTLFAQVESTVAEIRHLRGRAQSLAQQAMDAAPDAGAEPGAGPPGGAS
jgi:ATP-dependent Clp protease ATP-binding subunit ClpA